MFVMIDVSAFGNAATFRVESYPKYTLELLGSHWAIRRSDQASLAEPLRKWRRTPARETIKGVIPEVLAFIFEDLPNL